MTAGTPAHRLPKHASKDAARCSQGKQRMIVGIDLGTTNSLVAAWVDGAPRLIPNALGSVLTPSCVGLDDDGSVLVGEAARERLQTHPFRTASLFKRYMGSGRTVHSATATTDPKSCRRWCCARSKPTQRRPWA